MPTFYSLSEVDNAKTRVRMECNGRPCIIRMFLHCSLEHTYDDATQLALCKQIRPNALPTLCMNLSITFHAFAAENNNNAVCDFDGGDVSFVFTLPFLSFSRWAEHQPIRSGQLIVCSPSDLFYPPTIDAFWLPSDQVKYTIPFPSLSFPSPSKSDVHAV